MYWRRVSIVGVVLVVVVAVIALIGRSYVLADPGGGTTGLGFDDPYTQIVNHEIPNSDKIPVQANGTPTNVPGWGRYYAGPNGLEIRFNRAGTVKTAKLNTVVDSVALGSVVLELGSTAAAKSGVNLLGNVVMSTIQPEKLKNAIDIANAGANAIGVFDSIYTGALKDDCIGVTVPKDGSVNSILTRVDALAQLGVLRKLTLNPDLNDIWRANLAILGVTYAQANIRVWIEPCAPGDKDVAAPPAPPVGDTQPAVKAAPIPLPAQPAQPVAPVTAPASPPAPVTHPAPPPPPPTPPEACWLAGPDYRSYVRTSNQNDVLFYEREREPDAIIQLQVPNPKWMTWTQNTGGVWRLEGAYKDPEGQDMWTEGEFWSAPFWTDGKTQEEIDTQLQAYHSLQGNWSYDMNLVQTAPQC